MKQACDLRPVTDDMAQCNPNIAAEIGEAGKLRAFVDVERFRRG